MAQLWYGRETEPQSVRPAAPRRLMKLEAVRGFAAAYVVIGHSQVACTDRPFLPLAFGQEVVILFFILSGFVIHYSTCVGREPEPFRAYFFRRFRRIYPLFLLAIGFSYLMACVGERQLVGLDMREAVGNLFMLQDVSWLKRGTWVEPFRGNVPLWSLSYEWWYYMLFYPLVFWVRGWVQKYVVAGLAVSAFILNGLIPNQASLFLIELPIWWAGVELSREYSRTRAISWRGQGPMIAILGLVCALWFVATVLERNQGVLGSMGKQPVLQLRFSIASILFVMTAIVWSAWGFRGFRATLGWFSILSPISYALYIFHHPLLELTTLHMPRGTARTLAVVASVVLVVPLAYMLECRLQPRINSWTDAWLRRLNTERPRRERRLLPWPLLPGNQ
ncbi:acyltransferase family protein [Singulisphaera rosea]